MSKANINAQCPHCERSVENNTTGFCPHCGATLLSKKRKNSVFCYSMTRRNKVGAVIFSLLTILLAFYGLYLTSQRVGYVSGIESNYLAAKELIDSGSYAMDLEVFKDYQRFEALNTFYLVMAPFMMVFSVLSAFFALMGFLRLRFSFRPMAVLNLIGIFVLIADAGLCSFLGVYTFLISGAVALALRIIMIAPFGKYASIARSERISYKKAGKTTTSGKDGDNVPSGPADGEFIFYTQRPSTNKFDQQAPVIVQGKDDEMSAVVPFKKDEGTAYEELMKNASDLVDEMGGNSADPVAQPKQPEPAKPVDPAVQPKQPEPAKPVAPAVQPKQPEPAKPVAPVAQPKQPEPAKPVAPVAQPKQPEPAKPVAPVAEPKQPESAKPVAPAVQPKQPEPAKPAAPAVETKKPEPIRPMVIRPEVKPAAPKKTAEQVAEEERQASIVNRASGPWQCPKCGQMNYASSTECMNCGVRKE
ncbi:MAG: hypothetical protein IJZ95_04720 [Oscillospiraceae bacterium]|nr:hypothetical protein [Oscillospiraceae bacterium]